ncbi:hypothetical protein [Streptomyces sp. NPDC058548]
MSTVELTKDMLQNLPLTCGLSPTSGVYAVIPHASSRIAAHLPA